MESQFQRAKGTCAQELDEAYAKVIKDTKGFLSVACPCCKQESLRAYWRQFGFARLPVENGYHEFRRGTGYLWCHACKTYGTWDGLLPFWWPKEDPLAALREQGAVNDVDDYDAHWDVIAKAIPWRE
jgi:uncharacterized protein YbaR (Trm112 family)